MKVSRIIVLPKCIEKQIESQAIEHLGSQILAFPCAYRLQMVYSRPLQVLSTIDSSPGRLHFFHLACLHCWPCSKSPVGGFRNARAAPGSGSLGVLQSNQTYLERFRCANQHECANQGGWLVCFFCMIWRHRVVVCLVCSS